MQQICDGLFIGDYPASQNVHLLKLERISHVLCVLTSSYSCPLPDISVFQLHEEDTAQANLIQHFNTTNNYIHKAIEQGGTVLIHCQAGVSRSATLAAAYLVWAQSLSVEAALSRIRLARAQIDPSQTFRQQLDLFHSSNNTWDPTHFPQQRHFLLALQQRAVVNGSHPTVSLAYYPSPTPSQVELLGEPSTPIPDSPTTPPSPIDPPAPRRKRLTARSAPMDASTSAPAEDKSLSTEKLGDRAQVTVSGKRIRCKMCRRELAGREHILVHEPGAGQQAFAPHRRDIAAYRSELERKRLDQLEKERREALGLPQIEPESKLKQQTAPPTPAIAGLRISQPIQARQGPGVPGLRVAVPRPAVARPPVARPQPKSAAQATNAAAEASQPAAAVTATEESPAAAAEVAAVEEKAAEAAAPTVLYDDAPVDGSAAEPEAAPLLPSHLCSSYFVEPLSWMASLVESGALSGKIVCPSAKCAAKLGSFDWAGAQCSCGAWVLPAFQINVSRVDEIVR